LVSFGFHLGRERFIFRGEGLVFLAPWAADLSLDARRKIVTLIVSLYFGSSSK